MLSLQFIRENEAWVREAMGNRHAEPPLDQILELDRRRRELLQEVEGLRAQRNQLTSQIGTSAGGDRQELIDQTRDFSARLTTLEPEIKALDEQLDTLLLQVPNLPHPSVPIGRAES